jgi:hypothetical protein
MILITSAAYCSPALVAEFGKLPPCMLPVQNKRLYEHQLALIPPKTHVILTLPQSYKVADYDAKKFATQGVEVVKISEQLSLGESICEAISRVGEIKEPLYILHGDTLFSKLDFSVDTYAVANPEDEYAWAQSSDSKVYAGWFGFADVKDFKEALRQNDMNFVKSHGWYAKRHDVKDVELPGWLDFGLVNSYYRSCSRLTTQRAFNDLMISRYGVRKYSCDKLKMRAEAEWFKSLPYDMRHYAPAVWDSGENTEKGYYEIEYFYNSTLANLWVYGENPLNTWKEIFAACAEFVSDEYAHKPQDIEAIAKENDSLYVAKTRIRLQKYREANGVSMDVKWRINGKDTPSLQAILEELDEVITKHDTRFTSLMHGDMCFSNILYDFKSKSIKVIDPRGLSADGHISMWGDVRYDVAKLAHSVLGMYDYIIGGRYTYRQYTANDMSLVFDTHDVITGIQTCFKQMRFAGYTIEELSVYPIMILLFLSMLPLHADRPDRQNAFLANALRLYVEYKTNKI